MEYALAKLVRVRVRFSYNYRITLKVAWCTRLPLSRDPRGELSLNPEVKAVSRI